MIKCCQIGFPLSIIGLIKIKNNLWIFYSQIITLEDGKLGGIWKTCSPRFLNIQLSITNPILHVSVFFKKDIIKQIGCYRDIPKVEDYDLWLRLFKYANQRKNKEALQDITYLWLLIT